MKITESQLPGLLVIDPAVYGDQRGFFMETYNQSRYREVGLNVDFVQDNLSFSKCGTLRGLHFQNPNPQGKLVQALSGEIYDVAVDIRKGSPTFGQWEGFYLSDDNKRQLYLPPGFAHGFVVTSESALFSYKCTDFYNPGGEHTIRWDDSEVGIRWPVEVPTLSEKDRQGLRLSELPADCLVDYAPA